MEHRNLIVSRKEYVARVSINHPPANTWNLATMLEFQTVVHVLERDPAVRVVVITGAGEKCFSAGFDVTDAANAPAISEKGRAVWSRLDRFPKPVIAGINGHALGGGLELAIACHLRLVADRPEIKLGLTELNLGIMPGWGGTQRLPRLIGRQKALQMILFSTTVGASEALAIGLVDYLCKPEEFENRLDGLAQRLAERPPVAVRCTLEAMSAGRYEGMDRGLGREAQGSAIVRQTADREEGFRAFLEKRKPTFIGR
jgi:enoyl-CoA hydratase/carnithine racemase